MIRSMFAAVSGLRTHQTRLDVVGNNIANVNTYGFKPGRATFKESIYQTTHGSSQGSAVYGGQNPSQVGYGSQVGGISLDFGVGNYEPTGYGTDCMISGNGFFLVGPKIKDGTTINNKPEELSQLKLTRVGAFTVDGDGYLVDENRNIVYGFAVEGGVAEGDTELKIKKDNLVPIRIPSASQAAGDPPMKLKEIAIDSNGILMGINEDGKMCKVAQMAICNVPNPNALEKAGDSYYKAVSNTGGIEAFPAGEGTTGNLITNGLEMSKTDLSQEISNMIIAQRGLQANTRMITVSDEVLQELINMKR